MLLETRVKCIMIILNGAELMMKMMTGIIQCAVPVVAVMEVIYCTHRVFVHQLLVFSKHHRFIYKLDFTRRSKH